LQDFKPRIAISERQRQSTLNSVDLPVQFRKDCLYFVKWGEVSLTMLVADKEVRIRAGKGSLLGLPAPFGNQPYTMTAKATWDAEIFKLSSDAFMKLLNQEPRMKEVVLQVLAGEVRAIRQAFSQLI